MPKIEIYYVDSVNKTKDETVLEISYYIPKTDRKRYRYVYYWELKQLGSIFGRFLAQETLYKSNNFGIFWGCELNFTDLELEELIKNLKERTVCENVKLNDGISGFNLLIDVYKRNPKFWEVD